ncbi:MAG: class I SAM-dependent methyltransferase, partial [Planctomycetales bacterium]|nr:class I SAM-dependent methyltransferase [Planctomycetales bacterium]
MCTGCSLISHEHIPTDNELASYYATQYRQNYHGTAAPSPHRVLRAWQGGEWLLKRLLPHIQPGGRVCEIGAGLGCTVKLLELAGFDADGIEPGESFHTYARECIRARITRSALDEMPLEPHYDFILLVHVIEHFNTPSRALSRIAQMLRPGGRLYVECPNVAAPHAAPGRQFHFAHIYNFTLATLRCLAQTNGFEVVATLADAKQPNLRLLLERTNAAKLVALPCYITALRNWQSQTSWRYYARIDYLKQRLHRELRFASQHIAPQWRVAQ